MSLKNSDVLGAGQFSREQFESLFVRADEFAERRRGSERIRPLDGKVLATLFYEPSTRARLSFESAMQRLGGSVISIADAKAFSSAARGESLEDTVRALAELADVIVLRHPETGAAEIAAEASAVPLVNAGDGAGEHPSQALADLHTIRAEKNTIDGLRIALVGDLKNSRAAHSLARALGVFRVEISLVAPAVMALPIDQSDWLRQRGLNVEETNDLPRVLEKTDVVYMTRVQKEFFNDTKLFEKMRGFFALDRTLLARAKVGITILHPLMRLGELPVDVDALPSAAYFRQVKSGLLTRMALLEEILG